MRIEQIQTAQKIALDNFYKVTKKLEQPDSYILHSIKKVS